MQGNAKKFIEVLRRICCEEAHQARQARKEELSLQQQRFLTTVSEMMTQILDLRNTNSLSDARECYDSETASSSGASHVPSQPLIIPTPREVPPPRFWIASKYTELYGYYGKRFRTATCSRRTTLYDNPAIQRIWYLHLKNGGLTFQRQQKAREQR